MPPPVVQRKASDCGPEEPDPTITDPSAERSLAELKKFAPGKSPKPTIPPAVQRKASKPESPEAIPTTTEPSAETFEAELKNKPPGSEPRLVKLGGAADD